VNLPWAKTEIIEKSLRHFQKRLSKHESLIIDEPGFVPLPKTGAGVRFEIVSRRRERPPRWSPAIFPCRRRR
jgi:hypothetical protein